MAKSVPGNPQIDKEFSSFLKMLDYWDKKRLDNVNAPLLKKALEKMGPLQGRISGAVMTNLEQQIGALKGEYRKFRHEVSASKITAKSAASIDNTNIDETPLTLTPTVQQQVGAFDSVTDGTVHLAWQRDFCRYYEITISEILYQEDGENGQKIALVKVDPPLPKGDASAFVKLEDGREVRIDLLGVFLPDTKIRRKLKDDPRRLLLSQGMEAAQDAPQDDRKRGVYSVKNATWNESAKFTAADLTGCAARVYSVDKSASSFVYVDQ